MNFGRIVGGSPALRAMLARILVGVGLGILLGDFDARLLIGIGAGFILLLAFIAALFSAAGLAAAETRPRVVTSFFPLYCWTVNVAGTNADTDTADAEGTARQVAALACCPAPCWQN